MSDDDLRDVGIPQYVVHSFTSQRYRGNPAAVCLCDAFPEDDDMRRIAAENRLSETAFAVPQEEDGQWSLRWFTPAVEVPLCGHATLATAFVLFHEIELDYDEITFHSTGGLLRAYFEDGRVRLDFPLQQGAPCVIPAALREVIGAEIEEAQVFEERYLLRLSDEDAVRTLAPDLIALADIPQHGVIVTAPGRGCDFVSRFFAPTLGVPEDPVTGSAHCMLAPYWAERLGKTTLEAQQVSARGGELTVRVLGDRVHLLGAAVLHARGEVLPL